MNSLRNIAATFLILSFNSFVLSQVTDSHGGDFVIVANTTTYESLPFVETFYDPGPGLEELDDLNWVTAQYNGDYYCFDGDCNPNGGYRSSLTPADSFFLSNNSGYVPWGSWSGTTIGNSNVEVWKLHNGSYPAGVTWCCNPVARFEYSHTR
ncbi:MAG TPA: hypothetical protein EYM74_03775, partial [Candidatus Marinimicrobia bacterium]|nr:hypothetical protein [Candidatus Neomarinimicrobiota bacterium]